MGRQPAFPRNSRVVRIFTAGLLALAMSWPLVLRSAAQESDPTVISAQTVRHALDLAPDKQVRIVNASLEVQDKAEIVISQNFALDFGTLCDRTGSVLVGADGNIQDNSDQLYYGGNTQAAQFSLTGDAMRQVTIDFSSAPAGGFTLSDFVTNYGAPPIATQFDGAGTLTIELGARLTIDSTVVEPGDGQSVGYTLTSIYD
jgi:hypothetical protein